jgi:glycosyltransferase involved in cell wall biosynthesis
MRPIIFNGKFYSGSMNGVHRVADRLIREVDRLVGEMDATARPTVDLLLPKQRCWTPALHSIRVREEAIGHTQRWEQLLLPGKARGAVLVNLCNLAPLGHRRKILLLHDAQFLFPDNSYPVRQRWGHRLLAPAMARSSARVLTVSQYSRQILDLTGISEREKTHVLYNGIDHMLDVVSTPDAVRALGLAPQTYVLIFGSPKRYKNVELLFEAFRHPSLAQVRLVVVGAGEDVHRAAGMVPPPGCLFVGSIADETLRALYEGAICLAFPSRTEGFGLPPLEAMILGCPALVAPAGAIPEICRDTASYADVDHVDDWVASICALRDDLALRAEKIASGRRRATQFTWGRAGTALLKEALSLARS